MYQKSKLWLNFPFQIPPSPPKKNKTPVNKIKMFDNWWQHFFSRNFVVELKNPSYSFIRSDAIKFNMSLEKFPGCAMHYLHFPDLYKTCCTSRFFFFCLNTPLLIGPFSPQFLAKFYDILACYRQRMTLGVMELEF